MLRGLVLNKNFLVTTFNMGPLSQAPMSVWSSNTEESKDKYTQVEKSYAEWKFVEKLMPPVYVPEPPTDPTKEYPSGWKPLNPHVKFPYHIYRTKNHMLPVYYMSKNRSCFQFTRIKKIEGNIWILEKDVGNYLKSIYPEKNIITRSHELSRFVEIRGDYLDEVKEWVQQQGF